MSTKSSSSKQISNLKNAMDKYEVKKYLGEGCFGRVFKAKVLADSSIVALKFICKRKRSEKEIISLRREFEIQRYLSHPNIIQMLDSFETPNEIVVVTEFAHKELNSILSKKGLPEERAAPIIWDLISALNYLHSHRVLHRDLKPENILVDSKNRAKLCDFGFARNMSTGTHVLTSIKGTPLYMAPELIKEEPYDYKADLWSLGCIMYQILVGAPPFPTDSLLTLIRKVCDEQIQWPTNVSEQCITFLKGLLQKNPLERFNWDGILNHSFVKGHILICDDSTNKPLTRAMSENTLQAVEQQRKDLQNKSKMRRETVTSAEKYDSDIKNNNLSDEIEKLSLGESCKSNKLDLIEENQPIETEEWIVFLQKSMEEVIDGEMTSLIQVNLANILVSPLRNRNTHPKVFIHVAKLLSLPFAMRGVCKDSIAQIKKTYMKVKLVPNLVYASKLIMRAKSQDGTPRPASHPDESFKTTSELSSDDIDSLECIYMLITHLVHLDKEFLSQFCDAIAVLKVADILRMFFQFYKIRLRLIIDITAIFTHLLRVYPENLELVENVILSEDSDEKCLNFVEILRCNDPLLKERGCFFLLFLGMHLSPSKIEHIWNESVRETLEALMYDSIESVRNTAEKTVEELKSKDFYH